MKRDLVVAANIFSPYLNLKLEQNKSWQLDTSIEKHFLITLSRQLNFTFRVHNCKFDWGEVVNGSWTGLVGAIMSGMADIGLGGVFVTEARNQVIDYTIPYAYAVTSFITAVPNVVTSPYLVTEAFTFSAWCCTWSCLLIISLTLTRRPEMSIKDGLWFSLTSFFDQEGNLPPITTNSFRSSCFLLYFFGLIIRTVYSGKLYSLLTFPKTTNIIESVEELLSELKACSIRLQSPIWDEVYVNEMLMSPSEVVRDIGRRIFVNGSESEVYEKVKSSSGGTGYATIGVRTRFDLLMIKSPDTYYLPTDVDDSTFYVDRLAFVLPKGNTRFLTQINHLITYSHRYGLFDFWTQNVFLKLSIRDRLLHKRNAQLNNQKEKEVFFALTTETQLSTFCSYILGALVAFLALFFEMFTSEVSKQQGKRRNRRRHSYLRRQPWLTDLVGMATFRSNYHAFIRKSFNSPKVIL